MMKERYFKYVSLIAILVVFSMQYIWFSETYQALENDLYNKTDACFKTAVEKELIIRINETECPPGTKVPRSGRNGNTIEGYLGFNDLTNSFDNPRNFEKLDSLYILELASCNIRNLSFTIATVQTDTAYYHTEAAFDNDTAFVAKTRSEFKTHIVPVLLDLSEGIQATIVNPYKAILERIWLFMICSFAFIMLVIYCIVQQIRLINHQYRIATIRQDLTYAMIHDMKTPISAISMIGIALSSEAIENNLQLRSNYCRILNEEATHLLNLSDKVLTIAKLEQKRQQFNIQEVNMLEAINKATDKFKLNAGKEVHFTVKCDHTHRFYTDKDHLHEIFDNLIDNAIKYSGEKVEIIISVNRTVRYMEVGIRDNGLGISQTDKKRIFNKFERGEMDGVISGHGLGLNYVCQIVKAQKGYIRLESEAGVFTEFRIGLPLNPAI
jgi:two-component system phosphate regulon sensor histidine kinase PhoR